MVWPLLQAKPLATKQDAFSPQVQEFWSTQVPNISIVVIISLITLGVSDIAIKLDRDYLQGTLSIALVSVFFPLNV